MRRPASNAEWLHWGRHDPMYGVLTLPDRQRGGSQPWQLAQVREQGAAYFGPVMDALIGFGVLSEHAVEIGCGCGRITAQLVEHFGHVTALDVSPDQLALARIMLGDAADRASLHVVTEPHIPLDDGTADLVYSVEVLQHLDSFGDIVAYLREAHRALRPGGVLAVHVPVTGIHGGGWLASPLRHRLLRVLRAIGRRRMMVYRAYPAGMVFAALEAIGFRAVELRVFRQGDHERHGYYLARK
jgi:SAM-dependent methyltransferase